MITKKSNPESSLERLATLIAESHAKIILTARTERQSFNAAHVDGAHDAETIEIISDRKMRGRSDPPNSRRRG